jgi:capsular exopolysaccharide synthesis family protein
VWRLAVSAFGLVLGTAFVLLRAVFSNLLQNEGDALGRIGALPIVARIPRRIGRRQRTRLAESGVGPDFAADATSAFAEAFRTLRASLYHSQGAGRGRVVLVTSPWAGDGKTTTTFALAASLARDGRAVLVIEADLRRPSHHALLGTPADAGLSDVLTGKSDWRDATRSTSMQNVYSMTAGGGPFADLLSSERLPSTLNAARSHFDFILLDAPSFPAASDAMILCAHSDCVLSVLRLRNTPRKAVAEHAQGLLAVASYHAVVLNDVGATLVGPVPTGGEQAGRLDAVQVVTASVDEALRAADPLPLRNPLASREGGPAIT